MNLPDFLSFWRQASLNKQAGTQDRFVILTNHSREHLNGVTTKKT